MKSAIVGRETSNHFNKTVLQTLRAAHSKQLLKEVKCFYGESCNF